MNIIKLRWGQSVAGRIIGFIDDMLGMVAGVIIVLHEEADGIAWTSGALLVFMDRAVVTVTVPVVLGFLCRVLVLRLGLGLVLQLSWM